MAQVLEASENNIKQTFLENALNRNKTVCHFVKMIAFSNKSHVIALDADWGAGKTFFVKQAQLVLRSIRQKDNDEVLNIYQKHMEENMDELDDSIVSFYYDAWANDDSADPLLSLLYTILSDSDSDYTFNEKTTLRKIIQNITEAVTQVPIQNSIVKAGVEASAVLAKALTPEDGLRIIKERKNIKKQITDFFESLPIERANRIIIIIDELDRCNPTFAVKLLEQIKHYIDQERITFVFAINKRQLAKTIQRFYGDEYEAEQYLDRFFDVTLQLPELTESVRQKFLNLYDIDLRSKTLTYLIQKYAFSLRQSIRYLNTVDMTCNVSTNNQAYCLCQSCIIPLIIALYMSKIDSFKGFIHGNHAEPLVEIAVSNEFSSYFEKCFLDDRVTYPDREKAIREKTYEFYNAVFQDKESFEELLILGSYATPKALYEYMLNEITLITGYQQL